eukprot:scaffold32060_cov56-Attheya_sp.AAC.2
MVDCYSSNNLDKPLLPINIDAQLPHIKISVGSLSDTVSLALSVLYDTAAVVNVGNTDFYLASPKQFPHMVKSLTWAKDKFTQLTLSGVVSKDTNDKQAANLCTLLPPVVIEYHMPYKSKAGGSETSIKFALGKNVGVNSILSNSTIRAAKMIMDVVDEVVDAGVLDTDYPSFMNMDKSGTSTFLSQEDKAILANITICEALLTQNVNGIMDLAKEVRAAIIDSTESDLKEVAEKTISFDNNKHTD